MYNVQNVKQSFLILTYANNRNRHTVGLKTSNSYKPSKRRAQYFQALLFQPLTNPYFENILVPAIPNDTGIFQKLCPQGFVSRLFLR